MKKKSDQADREFGEIKAQLAEVQNDLRRFIEQSNKQQLEFIQTSSRKDLTSALISHLSRNVRSSLDENMSEDCEMRETCKDKIQGILLNNASMLGQEDSDANMIIKNKAKLDQLRTKAPYERCKVCLAEAYGIYEDQVDLMSCILLDSSLLAQEAGQHQPVFVRQARSDLEEFIEVNRASR